MSQVTCPKTVLSRRHDLLYDPNALICSKECRKRDTKDSGVIEADMNDVLVEVGRHREETWIVEGLVGACLTR